MDKRVAVEHPPGSTVGGPSSLPIGGRAEATVVPNEARAGVWQVSTDPSSERRGFHPIPSPIRLTAEERQRRALSARAVVVAMAAIENGPDEDDGAFLRALDESNPGRFELTRFYSDGPDPA